MTAPSPTFSLRRAALAVTTITVAFGAGEVVAAEVAPANDVSAITVRQMQQQVLVEHAPAFDPYADAYARAAWTAPARAKVAPAASAIEASASGYVVQVGAFERDTRAIANPEAPPQPSARLGPITARL